MQKFILFFLLITVTFSCNVNRGSDVGNYRESTELVVEQAFIQKEIPGTQGEESKFYVTIQIEPFTNSRIILDSIVYISSTYNEVRIAGINAIKFEVTEKESSLSKDNGVVDRATIFFTKDKQNYRQTISKFLTKEPIYLP